MQKIIIYLEYILVVSIISIVRLLGIDNASSTIGHLARFLGPLHKSTLIAKKNLKLAFPKWSNEKTNDIIKDMWENLGRTIAELPYILQLSETEIKKRLKIKNGNLLLPIQNNKPFILIGGHFGNWEMATRAFIMLGANPLIIYRKANNPLVNKLINKLRNNQEVEHIQKGQKSAIKFFKALKQNRSVALLVDQKLNNGIKAKFLNKDAMTTNMPAKLALKLDVPIIYGRMQRHKGANFTFSLTQIQLPKHITDAETAIQQITQDINNIIEKDAKTYPGQWFWVHKRFDKKFYK